MRPYEAFAHLYDRLTAGFWKHHARTLDLLLPPGPGRALDLACGTGAAVDYLVSRGYTVVGVDIEPEMVRLARARWPGCEFHLADMRSLPSLGTFDVVICCFDSINYLLEPADWRALFASVRGLLRDDGVFVFDTLRPEDVTRNWPGHCRVEDGPGFVYVERCAVEPTRGTGVTTRTFFHREPGGQWSRLDERHEQVAFRLAEIRTWLRRAGFESITVRGGEEKGGAVGSSVRVVVRAVARQRGRSETRREEIREP